MFDFLGPVIIGIFIAFLEMLNIKGNINTIKGWLKRMNFLLEG